MEDKRIESIIERVKPEAKEIKERSWGDEKIRKGIIKPILVDKGWIRNSNKATKIRKKYRLFLRNKKNMSLK